MNFFNKIPGFRSGKKINKIIASTYYIITLLIMSIFMNQIGLALFLLPVFIVPFLFLGFIDLIKSKNKLKSKYALQKIGIPLISMIISFSTSIALMLTTETNDEISSKNQAQKEIEEPSEKEELINEEKLNKKEEPVKELSKEVEVVKEEESTKEVESSKPTESSKKETSKKKQTNKKENKIKTSEIDKIILSKGHPIYYGSLEDAKKYAKKVSKKHIIVEGRYDEDTVLNIDGYDGIIRDIEIYPKNINEVVTEEKAIDIVDKYLPKDVLNKYYGEPSYKLYKPENNSKNTYKVINYGLTDEGSTAYYNKEHNYSGEVTAIIEEGKNGVESIVFKFGTPKWMNFASKNGYSIEEWKIK